MANAMLEMIGKWLLVALVVGGLAACSGESHRPLLSQSQSEDQIGFTALGRHQAWVNPPGLNFVMQRNLTLGAEQRLGLANSVAVPGDNQMVLRTRRGLAGVGRLQFEDLIERIGALPPPFTTLTSGELIAGEDSLGPYFWAERPTGADVSCVLGIRRLTDTMRELPQKARVMDVVLRNCQRGDAQQALAPMLDGAIGIPAQAVTPQGQSRLLSPLAAPGRHL